MEINKTLVQSLNAYINFKKDLENNKLSQAYLFLCSDKLTSKLLLEALAKLVVCKSKTANDNCDLCKKSDAGTNPDILVYPKVKNFSVEDAGDIYDKVQIKPMLGEKKVFVINNMDQATEQAQNKMLKIIEEPPESVVFLISGGNENKILKTIHSRVQKIYIDKFDKDILKSILSCDDNIKEIAVFNGDGYLGKTLDIATNDEFIKIYENVKNLVLNLKISSQVPYFSNMLSENRAIFETSLNLMNDFYRDILIINSCESSNMVKNSNLLSDFETIKTEYSVKALLEILKLINKYKKMLDSNVSINTLADGILMEILEVKFLCK